MIRKYSGKASLPFRFLTPFSIRSSRRPTASGSLAWRWLYSEKTVREAERPRLLSGEEESEALIRVAFDSLGQKQRVFEPYRLSLSSMVAQLSPGIFFFISKHVLPKQNEKD